MRKMILVFAITLLLLPTLFSSVSAMPSGGGDDPTPENPGTTEYYGWQYVNLTFHENEAYESGAVNNVFEYQAATWNNIKNQKITIKLQLGSDTGARDWNLWDSIYWEKHGEYPPRAILYQYPSWVDSNATLANKSSTGYIAAYTYTWEDWGIDSTTQHPEPPQYAYFSFLTNSTHFKPGIFRIDVQLYFHGGWFTSPHYETVATIYGEYTYGKAEVDPHHPPNDSITPDESGHFPPAYFNFTIHDGKWRVKFWYVGNGTEWHENNGVITGENVKLLKVWPSETGTFDKNSGDGGYIRLQYNFTENDSAGMYVWQLLSVKETGEYLHSWTLIVHNDMKVLDTNGDGQIDNTPPVIKISFKYDEQPEVNGVLSIVIRAWDNDSDATKITVYLFVFYSNNLWMAPDPSLNTMQLFMYAVDLEVTGNPKYVNVQLRYGGQLNVWAAGKDNHGAFNIDRAYIMVKDFEGAPGAAGFNITGNPWIMFPWESTLNMVILLIGVILMFTRKPTLQIIGILLFFAAFVNWGYVWEQITNALNPLNWFQGVIL